MNSIEDQQIVFTMDNGGGHGGLSNNHQITYSRNAGYDLRSVGMYTIGAHYALEQESQGKECTYTSQLGTRSELEACAAISSGIICCRGKQYSICILGWQCDGSPIFFCDVDVLEQWGLPWVLPCNYLQNGGC